MTRLVDRAGKALRGMGGVSLLHRLAVVLLLAATAFQMWRLLTDFVVPRAVTYWGARAYAPWERSALFSEGREFLEYVTFLRETVPASAKVVLPPHASAGEAGPYAYVTFMQYFLIPREVLNCSPPIEDCVLSLDGNTSYLVRVGSFPPPAAAEVHKTYRPFREELGVYVPK